MSDSSSSNGTSSTEDSDVGGDTTPLDSPTVVPSSPQTSTTSTDVVLSWPGYGILFFWSLGTLQYLQEHFDLSRIHTVGSSGGAFVAVFAKCGVDPFEAAAYAFRLCVEHSVFSRPLGLLGIWGGLVRKWLDRLLPADADQRCSAHTGVVVTHVPSLRAEALRRFASRFDLCEALMASAHVPLFLDFRFVTCCRGQWMLDGSFMYCLFGRRAALVPTAQELALAASDGLAALLTISHAEVSSPATATAASHHHYTPCISTHVSGATLAHRTGAAAAAAVTAASAAAAAATADAAGGAAIAASSTPAVCTAGLPQAATVAAAAAGAALQEPTVLLLDPRFDEELWRSWSLGKCLALLSLEGAHGLMQSGYQYAKRLHHKGGLAMLPPLDA